MEKIEIIKAEENHKRLDIFLTEVLKGSFDFSRSMIQKIIEKGNVSINDQVVVIAKKPIEAHDVIQIVIPKPDQTDLQPEQLNLKVVYEDEHLLVIDKANNMVVHPGAGNQSGTVVNGLLSQMKNLSSIGGVERPGIVHRLDKQTTGLLIVAKNDKTHRLLTNMLVDHQIYKEYIALVWGEFEENEGIIEAPIGRHENDRKKMAVTHTNSKYAKTNFKVLERYTNATLLQLSIETGRTHQIRVHLNFIKHPVMNDPLYGRKTEKPTAFGQYLHAAKLVFIHPITKKEILVESPLPSEFNDMINKIKRDGA
ncbi:RluA family pseudouridine synthase [Williamsoniiplasma lucivorax]|uniref:Pseudouridine synthase n=1 Tax=Williamsoniiplasma lucivorax TaxID=209274 RepID=A0A2S5RDS3_9MOLU|nr:RluA family pseudouridine synthase [Williamsoniiplasma lucivorax]PPE05460.1 23S rRNA pseudouridine 1911/1915/1917 synthase [Williamsoniiplasma lucivorax]